MHLLVPSEHWMVVDPKTRNHIDDRGWVVVEVERKREDEEVTIRNFSPKECGVIILQYTVSVVAPARKTALTRLEVEVP